MRLTDICELLLLAALWGGSFLFLRMSAPVLGPVWLIEIRVLIAGLALLLFFCRLNLIAEIRRKFLSLFVIGCINSAIPFLLLAFASLFLPAGFTSILNATTPLFGAIVAFVWLKEKLTFARMVGFALGFAGVVVLVGWRKTLLTPSFILAVSAGLLAALMYAIASSYIKQQLSDVSPLVVATGSQLGAAIFLLPLVPFTIPTAPVTLSIVAIVFALGLLSTAWAYVLYFRLIKNLGATKALTVTYLIPLFAILWGAIALHEPITESMVWGGGLILSGTAIAIQITGEG